MVVAGLAAEGETVITGVSHIDRGYDDLVGRLSVGRRRHRADLLGRGRRRRATSVPGGRLGPGHPAPGQGQQADDDGDRGGDEQDLVPAALVGDQRSGNADRGERR